jgi:hypothetical protein
MIKIKKGASIIAKTFFLYSYIMPLGLNEDSNKKVFHLAIKMILGTHCLL